MNIERVVCQLQRTPYLHIYVYIICEYVNMIPGPWHALQLAYHKKKERKKKGLLQH